MSHPNTNSGHAVRNLRQALDQYAASKPASSTPHRDQVGLFERAGKQALAKYKKQQRGNK